MLFLKSFWQRICLLFVIIVMVTVLAINCTAIEERQTIMLVEFDWTSQLILTEIIDQIISEQLGYSTERIFLSQPAAWAAMDKGEVDLTPEIWLPARLPEIQPYLERGTIELAGEIFPGGGGWVIPRYVVEGDPDRDIEPMAPDLKTILDLKEHWQLFENPIQPGKGELVGGEPGWVDEVQDKSRIMGYDLPLWRSNQSEAIMMSRMIAANTKGEPLLMYIWWPHWIFAEVDLLILEEVDPWSEDAFPSHTEEEPRPVRSAHPTYSINKVIRAELADIAPDVYSFMHNLELSEDDINILMLRVDVEGEDMAAVAADWIDQNQDQIDLWMSK